MFVARLENDERVKPQAREQDSEGVDIIVNQTGTMPFGVRVHERDGAGICQ